MAMINQVHDTGRAITGLDSKSDVLWREVQRLKDSGNPDAVAAVEQWAFETRSQADNLQSELEEVTQRWESLKKELGETRGTLSNSREKLSEAQGQLANS
ncbi:hypothetical protein B296_00026488 [Ensete ventricosum]|uniref:Uncharacterized protein n=1 Tax=Ensete ventricosum TaxID=4639 RepID=A0A426XUJ6_ENSVE|nr:hypothetical protein B296_00026488 [Ensete ventricosum]